LADPKNNQEIKTIQSLLPSTSAYWITPNSQGCQNLYKTQIGAVQIEAASCSQDAKFICERVGNEKGFPAEFKKECVPVVVW